MAALVASVAAAPMASATESEMPTCGSEADPDGDGYGWLGVWPDGESCRVVDDDTPGGGSAEDCVDPDGDGWGWRGEWPDGESCRVVDDDTPGGGSAEDCVDPDGDGWGWRGEWPDGESCQVGGGSAPGPAPTKPRAVVSIGDSYISGEGGRWDGNGDNLDRGIGVYGNTHSANNMCHRSDVAQIHSAAIPGVESFNFACSGATTDNVLRTGQYGEDPQLEQLKELTKTHDVEMVAISVGGNDADVFSLAEYCAKKSILPGSCKAKRYRSFHKAVRETVAANVDEVISAVRQVVDADTRIVLQSYVSPYGRTMRYKEPVSLTWIDAFNFSWLKVLASIGSEQGVHGCPIQAKDRLWARNEIVSHFDDLYQRIAEKQGIELLALADAFEGKELCAEGVTWGKHTTDPARLEWVRRLTLDNDRVQESLHPTANGQRALGRCLRLVWDAPGQGHHRCTNLGAGPNDMQLSHAAPTLPAKVTFTFDEVGAELIGRQFIMSAEVMADRDSPVTDVWMTLEFNGRTRTVHTAQLNLRKGEPIEITRTFYLDELTDGSGGGAKTTISVRALEGYLFGNETTAEGPFIPMVGDGA